MAAAASSSSKLKCAPVSSRAKLLFEQFFSENIIMNDHLLEGNEDLAQRNPSLYWTTSSAHAHAPPTVDEQMSMEPDYSQYHQPYMSETVARVTPQFSSEWNATMTNHTPESNFVPRKQGYDVQQHQLLPHTAYWENRHDQGAISMHPAYSETPHSEFSIQPRQPDDSRMHYMHPSMMHGLRHPRDAATQAPPPISYDEYAHANTPWIQAKPTVPTNAHHHFISEPDPLPVPRSSLPAAARTTPWGHPQPHRISYDAVPSTYHGHLTTGNSSTSAAYINHYSQVPTSRMTYSHPTQQYRMMM
jgi:hypothetical protein